MFLINLILTIAFLGFGLLLYHAPDEILNKYHLKKVVSTSIAIISLLLGLWFAIALLADRISRKLLKTIKSIEK